MSIFRPRARDGVLGILKNLSIQLRSKLRDKGQGPWVQGHPLVPRLAQNDSPRLLLYEQTHKDGLGFTDSVNAWRLVWAPGLLGPGQGPRGPGLAQDPRAPSAGPSFGAHDQPISCTMTNKTLPSVSV